MSLSEAASTKTHGDRVRQVVSSASSGRSAIAASWRRSLRNHVLDPESGFRPERVAQSRLTERREESRLLLRVAEPLLDRLAGAALDAGAAVMLADASGLVLEERMHASDDGYFDDVGLKVGAEWSEATEGTNGIGTCLAERRAVVIWRQQHFHARNTGLTCMSAPIEDHEGGLAGVLDISSCRSEVTESQARLVALSVQDTAMRISIELFRVAFSGARIIAVNDEALVGPCLLAVDEDDFVLGANRAARRALNLDGAAIAAQPPARDLLRAGPVRSDFDEAMRVELRRALRRAGGNVTAAARALRIGRATIYRRMQALGLRPDRDS